LQIKITKGQVQAQATSNQFQRHCNTQQHQFLTGSFFSFCVYRHTDTPAKNIPCSATSLVCRVKRMCTYCAYFPWQLPSVLWNHRFTWCSATDSCPKQASGRPSL